MWTTRGDKASQLEETEVRHYATQLGQDPVHWYDEREVEMGIREGRKGREGKEEEGGEGRGGRGRKGEKWKEKWERKVGKKWRRK